MLRFSRFLPLALLLSWGGAALAMPPPPSSTGPAPTTCAPAIAAAEAQDRLPAKLLGTIALVESGRPDPATGRDAPWPWTIDAGGVGTFYATKAEAIAAVQALQQQGVRSIDVGCLQINLLHHPDAFVSLDEAFDPMANASYGARFLDALHRQFGSWPQAAAAYHSQTPGIGEAYESRVMALWPLASRFPDVRLAAANAVSAAPDYTRYTPEFAARVRQMVADRARLEARFGALVAARRRGPKAQMFGQDMGAAPSAAAVRPVG